MKELGYDNEDLTKFFRNNFADFITPEYLGKYRSFMLDETPEDFTFPFIKSDGSQIYLTLRSHRLDPNSPTTYVFTILTKTNDYSKLTEILKLSEQQLAFSEDHPGTQILSYDYLTSHWHIPADYAS